MAKIKVLKNKIERLQELLKSEAYPFPDYKFGLRKKLKDLKKDLKKLSQLNRD